MQFDNLRNLQKINRLVFRWMIDLVDLFGVLLDQNKGFYLLDFFG